MDSSKTGAYSLFGVWVSRTLYAHIIAICIVDVIIAECLHKVCIPYVVFVFR